MQKGTLLLLIGARQHILDIPQFLLEGIVFGIQLLLIVSNSSILTAIDMEIENLPVHTSSSSLPTPAPFLALAPQVHDYYLELQYFSP